MKKEMNIKISTAKTISGNKRDYYLELLAAKVNKSSEEEILAMSHNWGRSEKEAQSDLARVENLYFAVGVFLDKALEEVSTPITATGDKIGSSVIQNAYP